jgi:gliding motility-associated protein GldL
MLKIKKFNWLHVAISWGASIVILGAMFKINHLGGQTGSYMIGLGLSVEATLFFILGFFPPAKDPEWERVYPELAEDYSGSLVPAVNKKSSVGNQGVLERLFDQPALTPEDVNNLGEGLKRFSDKVSHINDIADASIGTDEFFTRLKLAGSKFDLLGSAFERAAAGLEAVGRSKEDAQAYHHEVFKLTHNLSQLNSLYEAELSGADNNLKQINEFYHRFNASLQNLNESATDTNIFKAEVSKLSKNLSALNALYGNMLTAMNQPRVA